MGARDEGCLRGAVRRREVEVVGGGDDGGAGADPSQGSGQRTVAGVVGPRLRQSRSYRHVVGQPDIQHGQEIVGIVAAVGRQPGALHVLLHIGMAQQAVPAAAVERLAGGPAGVDQGEGAQTALRDCVEALPLPGRIGGEGVPEAEEKQAIVGRGAGGAADTADPRRALWFEDSPVVRLLRPHGPAVDQGRRLNAEGLLQEPPLGADIVDVAEAPAVLPQAEGTVARAAGAPPPELADLNDAPARRVEHRTHQPVQVVRPAAVGAGVEDHIGAAWLDGAVHPILQVGLRQHSAALEGEITEGEALVPRTVHRAGAAVAAGAAMVAVVAAGRPRDARSVRRVRWAAR